MEWADPSHTVGVRETPTIEYRAADFVESVLPRTTFADLDPETLVDAIAGEMLSGPRPGLLAIAESMGVPARDCVGTVLSSRAMLMAAARGRAFYQHELRGRIPMPPHMFPEVDVWESGTVPVWEDGVFVEPKYFSFRQDAPFAAYNPVHRRKWRAHELLHGAVGFFWRSDASRFETYVGARLNELLPVVHWYGLDEVYRPRCERHQGEVLYREWCPDCEEALRPYWEVEPVDRADAVRFVRAAQEHLHRELEACRREIRTGEVHETPLGRLNASSDAVGYLLGHWPRVNAWSFRTWAELFLRDGFDYFSDLSAFADRVEACAARLVGGVAVTTVLRFHALRQRRVLQDLAYRALLALEWMDPDSPTSRAVDKTVMGALERCSQAVNDLVDSEDARWEAEDALDGLLEVLADVQDAFPPGVAEPLLALGLDFWPPGRDAGWEIANLAEGITQGAPLAADRIDGEHLQDFLQSDRFATQGRLVRRFGEYMSHEVSGHETVTDLVNLEAWASDDPRRDEDAERFAQEAESLDKLDPRQLRLNRTYRRAEFGVEAVAELATANFRSARGELAAAYWRGELHIVIVDDTIDDVLQAVREGRLPDDADAMLELMEAGLIVWRPGSELRDSE